MEERIVLEFVGDPSGLKPVIADLEKINNLTKEQANLLEKAGKEAVALESGFLKGSNGAKRLQEELAKQPKTLADMELRLQKLKELLRDDTQVGTNGFKAVQKAVADTEKEIAKANGTLGQTKKQGEGIISTFKNVAITLGIAFGVQQAIQLVKEMSTLAAKGEGVRNAFARVGSDGLLKDLRDATKGTVSDLELMQNAVRASNFKIPLGELAGLFEFARRRAKETGESVDYLVESITTGIGRKSPLILDNLGLTSDRLKGKLNGVSLEVASIGQISAAVGALAREELSLMGEEAEGAAERMAQLNAQWKNTQESIGDAINKSALYYAELFGFIDGVDPKLQGSLNAMKKFVGFLRDDLASGYKTVDDVVVKLVKTQQEFNVAQAETARLETELEAKRAEARNNQSIAALLRSREISKELEDAKRKEEVLRQEVKLINDIYKQEAARLAPQASTIKNYAYYQAALADIDEELKRGNTTVERTNVLLDRRNVLQKEFDALMGKSKEANLAAGSVGALTKQLNLLKAELEATNPQSERFGIIADQIRAKAEELNLALAKMAQALSVPPGDLQIIPTRSIKEVAEMEDTLDKLNSRLKEQQVILNASPEFSKMYREAAAEIERLEARIDEFGGKIKTTLNDVSTEGAGIAKTFKDAWVDELNVVLNGFQSLFASISRIQQNALRSEEEALQEQLDRNLISREAYDLERKKLLRKQARADRDAQLFNAIVSTAAAVAEALPNIPLSVLAGILGAAEIAAIASTPLPAFKKGTKNAPPGFKWVGEAGAELIYDRGGNAIITNHESQELAANPWGKKAQEIMKKYDIPQLHTGLFGAKSLQLGSDVPTDITPRDRIDYDRMAEAFVRQMRDGNHGLMSAVKQDTRVTAEGLHAVIRAIEKKHNDRAGW